MQMVGAARPLLFYMLAGVAHGFCRSQALFSGICQRLLGRVDHACNAHRMGESTKADMKTGCEYNAHITRCHCFAISAGEYVNYIHIFTLSDAQISVGQQMGALL